MSKQDDKYLDNVEDNTLENTEEISGQAGVCTGLTSGKHV